MPNDGQNPLLTMKAACKYMSVSRPMLISWAKRGNVRAFKVAGSWRFYQEDLDMAVRQGLPGLPHKPRLLEEERPRASEATKTKQEEEEEK